MRSKVTGQRHYKTISSKIWLPVTIPVTKSRNNAIHAFCDKATILLAANAATAKRMFL